MKILDINKVELDTKRLKIRKVKRYDLEKLYEIYSDPIVMKYIEDPVFTSMEMMKEFYESVKNGYETGQYYEFVILWEKTIPIGTCSLHSFNWDEKIAEIGYMLNRDYWKRGIMTEAINTVLDFSFYTLNLQEIRADFDFSNLASKNLLTRLGFTQSQDSRFWFKLKI